MKRIFLDMDGTLVKFNVPHALDRFEKEEKFFAKLKAYKGVDIINELCESGIFYIISASPHDRADADKMEWIREYLPNMPIENIVLCRLGENKAKVIEKELDIIIDSDCYLLDDYTKNLQEWENMGGIGIKRITHCADNSTKKWKGLELRDLCKLEMLVA